MKILLCHKIYQIALVELFFNMQTGQMHPYKPELIRILLDNWWVTRLDSLGGMGAQFTDKYKCAIFRKARV